MPKEALIIADMVNDFVLPGAPLEVPRTRKAIPAIRREIERAREEGNPVIYVCDGHDPDDKEFRKFGWPSHSVRGTKGSEVVEELKPQSGDIRIDKTTYSCFQGTNLDETLRRLDVNRVRLTGCVTHICILFTTWEAVVRDYGVTIVEDGVAGITKRDHDAAIRIMKNVLGAKIASKRGGG